MRDIGNNLFLIRGMKKLHLFDYKIPTNPKFTTLDIQTPYNVLCMAKYLIEYRAGKDGDIILYVIEYI
jgi:hypothetical protein